MFSSLLFLLIGFKLHVSWMYWAILAIKVLWDFMKILTSHALDEEDSWK